MVSVLSQAPTQLRALMAVILLATMSGCTSPVPQEASALTMPDTVWAHRAPQGEADTSEWANALREDQRVRNLAVMLGDFSDPDLIRVLGYDDALSLATDVQEWRFSDSLNYLQADQLVLASTTASFVELTLVEPSPAGDSADVEGCIGFYDSVRSSARAMPLEGQITRLADGRYDIHVRWTPADPTCTPETTTHQLWATPFTSNTTDRDTVKMPLSRQYYIDLGVISE